ncbi:MAG: hypothetical protein IT270_04020 [Saprospiraceae bacterium]|nr:hypothetical protein [Saprospiraceae bacterium]
MRLILLFACCFLGLNIRAQTETAQSGEPFDARLLAVYEETYLENLQLHNPMLLQRWHYYFDHAYTVLDWPEEKGDIKALPVVYITDVKNINILALEQSQPLYRDWDKPVFFRINDSRQVLMYHAGSNFNRDFQNWLQSR